MRFKNLDLNLLVALEALIEARGVSAAARRLNLSQPAVSAALAKLRDYLSDELLVMDGKRMHLTPFATELLPQLKRCLAEIDAMVSRPTTFDPAVSERTFLIAASDYVIAAVIVPLIAKITTEAPKVRVEIMTATNETLGRLAEGVIDILILPDAYLDDDHPSEFLFEERYVVLGWRENPIFGEPLTEEGVFSCGHVEFVLGPSRVLSFPDRHLAAAGKVRRVEIKAPSFNVAPGLVCGSNRLAFVPERLARAMARDSAVTYRPVPFPFPVMREMVQHHRARTDDDGLRWLRAKLIEVSA